MSSAYGTRDAAGRAPLSWLLVVGLGLLAVVLAIHGWVLFAVLFNAWAVDPSVAFPAFFLVSPLAVLGTFVCLLLFFLRSRKTPGRG